MKFLNKKTKPILLYGLIVFWIILWANFIGRDLIKRKQLKDYMILAGSNAEEKYAYTYGKRFFELLELSKKHIPEGEKFKFSGIEKFSLASRRGIYYMYPSIESKVANYILVDEGKQNFPGFSLFKKIDNKRFILKKR